MTLAKVKAERGAATLSDPRWMAVLKRDTNADGSFYYAVKTTGAYCRPSCPSRVAIPENISFHESREEAEQAGFRPCLRCKPDQLSPQAHYASPVTLACRIIEASDAPPSLADLAKMVGMSTYHFHRIFKKITGL